MDFILKLSDHLLLSFSLSLGFSESGLEDGVVFSEVINDLSFVVKVKASGLKPLNFDIFILLHDSLAIKFGDDIVVWETGWNSSCVSSIKISEPGGLFDERLVDQVLHFLVLLVLVCIGEGRPPVSLWGLIARHR
jgi:hypothetical protein